MGGTETISGTASTRGAAQTKGAITGQRAPAPEALRLLQDFVNTLAIETGEEQLPDPQALANWLRSRGLLRGDITASGADREQALRLREGLRLLLRLHAHERVSDERLRDVQALLAQFPLRTAVGATGDVALVPVGDGVEGALARLLVVLHEATRDGSWFRLKA